MGPGRRSDEIWGGGRRRTRGLGTNDDQARRIRRIRPPRDTWGAGSLGCDNDRGCIGCHRSSRWLGHDPTSQGDKHQQCHPGSHVASSFAGPRKPYERPRNTRRTFVAPRPHLRPGSAQASRLPTRHDSHLSRRPARAEASIPPSDPAGIPYPEHSDFPLVSRHLGGWLA